MIKKNDPILLFVFICLLKQADTWSYMFLDNVQHQTKLRYNRWHHANKMLLQDLKQYVDMEWVEDNSELFSDLLHFLASAEPDDKKKLQLIGALHAFMKGEAHIEEIPDPEIKRDENYLH